MAALGCGIAGLYGRKSWCVLDDPKDDYSSGGTEMKVRHTASLLFLYMLFVPASAFAHVKGGEVIGFLSGIKHPISGLDHVLAMITVGLWGAQLGAPAV